MPHKLFGLPQILRATMPIVTSPDPRSTTGLGDINMFNLFLFKSGPVELGVGPQLTIDSATDDRARDRQVAGGRRGYCSGPTAMGYTRLACYLSTLICHAPGYCTKV